MKTVLATFILLLAVDPQQQTAEQQLRELKDAVVTRVDAILASLQPAAVDPSGLQAAIDAAPAGATIYLRANTQYRGPLRIRRAVTLTTAGASIAGRIGAGDLPTVARIQAVNNEPAIDILPGTCGVTLAQLAVYGASNDLILVGHGDATQSTREQQPCDVTLSRIFIDGALGAKRGIGAHGRNVTIERSHCERVARAGADTQCIAGWNGEGPIVIRDNYLAAAGENVMFGGAAPGIPGLVPRDVQVLGNHFWKDPTWKASGYTVKNHLEFKVGDGVVVRGNLFENMWAAGQSYSIMLTPQAQSAPNPNCIVANVTIEQNTFRNVSGGIVIKGREQLETPCLQGSGFVVRRNWLPVDRTFNGGAAQGWPFFISGEPRDITIEQNTVDTNGNQVVYVEGRPVVGFRFLGNLVLRSGLYGFTGNGAHRGTNLSVYLPGAVITGNAFGSFPTPANLPDNLHMSTAAMLPLIIDGVGTGVLEPYGMGR